MNPEHWQHPWLGLGSPSGLGTGKSCSLEPRSGDSEPMGVRWGVLPGLIPVQGPYICSWLVQRGLMGHPMFAWCLRACPQGNSQSAVHLRHWGNTFRISRYFLKLGRWAPWYQPDAQIPSTPGSCAGFPTWSPPTLGPTAEAAP